MKKNIVTAVLLISFGFPLIAGAQTPVQNTGTAVPAGSSEYSSAPNNASYTLLEPLPCLNGTGQTCSGPLTKVNIKDYVIYIYKLAIALAVFLAVVMITWGGFRYMTIESITGKSDAKEIIQNALFGLLGALGSYLILYTINPQLVNINLITVPTLHLKDDANNLSNFQAALAEFNRNNTNNTISTNTTLTAAQQAIQSKLNSLAYDLNQGNCIDGNGNNISDGDPICEDLWTQYNNASNESQIIKSQQNAQKGLVNMTSAESTFENTNSSVHFSSDHIGNGGEIVKVGNTNINDAKSAIQNIDNTYNQTYSTLANTDTASKAFLTQQRTFNEANIVNDYNTSLALYNLEQEKFVISDSGSNTLLNQKVSKDIASANQLIDTLKSNSIPNQTTSNGIITNPVGTLDPNSTLGQQYAQANQAKINALQNAITAVQKVQNK